MEPVKVPVACPCPGTPHPDGDTVGLRAKLGLRAGTIVQKYIVDAHNARIEKQTAEESDLIGALSEAYLLQGVESWSFVDGEGNPLPVTAETIRSVLLDDFSVGAPVADAADDLYMAPVLLPLALKALRSSADTSTSASTSPSNGHTPTRRKRSRPSSTTTTQTGVTETITASPDGGSSS